MNKLEAAKKIITETKLALIKYIIADKNSAEDKNQLVKFIKESSSYDVLHYAAKGKFPKAKTVPMKSLLEQAVINRVISKINPKKSEMQHFSECCKEVLLNRYSSNKKVVNFIMKESTSYDLCHLAMVGKFPTDYSFEAKRNLHESIARKISNKYGKTSFIAESFLLELGNMGTFSDFKDNVGQTVDYFKGKRSFTNSDALKDRGSDALSSDLGVAAPGKLNIPDSPSVIDKAKAYGNIAKDAAGETFDKAKDAAGDKIEGAKNSAYNMGQVAKYHAGEASDGIMDKLHGLIAAGKESGSQAMAQLQKTVGDHPGAANAVGAVAAASLALYGANKLYRKFMGGAAQSAQGKAPAAAAVILKNARMKATQAKVADLQKSIAGCKATKNPAQCQKLIADKIKKERSKK